MIISPEEPKKPDKVSELQILSNKKKLAIKQKTVKSNRNAEREKSSKSEYLDDMELSLIPTRPAMYRENINIENHQQQGVYQNWINNKNFFLLNFLYYMIIYFEISF